MTIFILHQAVLSSPLLWAILIKPRITKGPFIYRSVKSIISSGNFVELKPLFITQRGVILSFILCFFQCVRWMFKIHHFNYSLLCCLWCTEGILGASSEVACQAAGLFRNQGNPLFHRGKKKGSTIFKMFASCMTKNPKDKIHKISDLRTN